MLYLWKKNFKKSLLMIKIVEKLGTIVILQVNIEAVQRIVITRLITGLHSRHPTIKFRFKYSKSSIEFLDTKIYKNKKKNKLLMTIYRKPIDGRIFCILPQYTRSHSSIA